MKIYQVYFDENIESKTNDKASFKSILSEMNGVGDSLYTTDKNEAIARYNSIKLNPTVNASTFGYGSVYIATGKLIVTATVDDEEFNELIEEGEPLENIFYCCLCGDFEMLEVSDEYTEDVDDEEDEK